MSELEVHEKFILLVVKELEEGGSKSKGDDIGQAGTKGKEKWKQVLPSDHYTIAESEWMPTDITAWLGSL